MKRMKHFSKLLALNLVVKILFKHIYHFILTADQLGLVSFYMYIILS